MPRVRFKTKHARHLCWDLENRPIAYWFNGESTSQITAIGWRWSDEQDQDVHTLLLGADGFFVKPNGRKVSQEIVYNGFRDVLESADLVYGHNIRKHDLPMLNAHLLRLQLRPLEPVLTCDTLRDIPKRGGMAASLANFAEMYELGGEKFHLAQHGWEKANQLGRDGMELARQRVSSDVILQERLRAKLLELGILKPARLWRP